MKKGLIIPLVLLLSLSGCGKSKRKVSPNTDSYESGAPITITTQNYSDFFECGFKQSFAKKDGFIVKINLSLTTKGYSDFSYALSNSAATITFEYMSELGMYVQETTLLTIGINAYGDSKTKKEVKCQYRNVRNVEFVGITSEGNVSKF